MSTTSNFKILIVDDEEDIREFVSQFLGEEGCEVISVADGQVALNLIKDGYRPDLILLDMRMPKMDGSTFARHYRQLPPPLASIVLMTAAADIGSAVIQVKPDGYLSKPFELDDLLALVEKFASGIKNEK